MDKYSVRLFTLSNSTLVLHWSWFLFMLLVFVQSFHAGFFLLSVFGFVVLHEYGHVIVAQKLGLRTGDIYLLPMGGAANIQMPYDKPSAEFWAVLAGPMVNVMLVMNLFPLWYFLHHSITVADMTNDTLMTLHKWVETSLIINIVLVIFNAIPAFPMDGGRIFRSLLSMATRNYMLSTVIAVRVGQVCSLGISVWGIYVGNWVMVLIGPFLIMSAQNELAVARMKQSREMQQPHSFTYSGDDNETP